MNILTVLIFLSTAPFLILFNYSAFFGGDLRYVFANICGFIGTVLLTWEMVLGVGYVKSKMTRLAGSLLKVHMTLGILGMFFIFLHPLLEMMSYNQLFALSIANDFARHLFLGQVALGMMILIWITSTFYRVTMNRAIWYWIHLLSYPVMGFIFIHAFSIGTLLNTIAWVQLYWYALIVIYLVAVLLRVYTLFSSPKKVI